MGIADVVKAMPKVELNVRLEGGFRKETLLMLAEQNEAAASTKKFSSWVEMLNNPDMNRLAELSRTVSGWLRHPDDLSRLVYDTGLMLAKQNVRYAEVLVDTSLYMFNGMSFEDFINALNDGRDRAERGWKIRMNWILVIRRDEPRHADDIVRWAVSATGKKGGVVGVSLIGKEDIQPVKQFERAFNVAHKKGLPTCVQVGNAFGAEGILDAVDSLHPQRLIGAWGLAASSDLMMSLVAQDLPIVMSPAEAVAHGWIESRAEYPYSGLYLADLETVLSSELPYLYGTTLNDEYIAAVEEGGLSLEELCDIGINAVRSSFLPEDERTVMLMEFHEAYGELQIRYAEEMEAQEGEETTS